MPLRLSLLFAAAACLLSADTVVYDLHPAPDNRFALTVEKTGLMRGRKHLFVFERYRGALNYDTASPERSRVEFAIEAASAVCKDAWVSAKDLKKIQRYALEDMLAAERHPKLRFVSSEIRRTAPGSFEVSGMLEIRGIAKPAVVSITVAAQPSGALASVSGHAVVRLKDYGLKPPTAALGAIGTKNEMTLDFQLAPAATMALTRADGKR